jgi:5-dehydro-2-deoxygluconokinase
MAAAAEPRRFDLIAMGRAAVDFYGEQVGGRLEDMGSFAKYLGGCPANISVGAARLGLDVAMLTRVGDEHMGRFVRETLAAEGVDVSHVRTDPHRLTGLVVLGIRDRETFPLIFYRENCADMAIAPEDFDVAFIGSARALLVTGTHFSTQATDAACRAAIDCARARGTKVVLDIDYRPVLWGLTSPGLGEQRFVASERVSGHLQSIVALCDLVVGTEEEIHIAGGNTDTIAALRRLRELTAGTLVVKRGARGCAIFPAAIPDHLDDGIVHEGFPTDVFNVLGAGDAFMAGLLSGWLRGKDWAEAARIANACGSLVVSRHGCAPAMPSAAELAEFFARASTVRALHADPVVAHLHHTTTGRRPRPEVLALAFDHREQFAQLASRTDTDPTRIARFKALIGEAVAELRRDIASFGIIVDDLYGRDVLDRMTGSGLWIARPVERPGSRPLAFGADTEPAIALRSWPVEHVAKCLVTYAADDPATLRDAQEAALSQLQRATHATGREWLLEIIPPSGCPVDVAVPSAVTRLYETGLKPDWWKLPPSASRETWHAIGDAIRAHDPQARGVLVLGSAMHESELKAAFTAAADEEMVRGFAIGRTIFWPAAEQWFADALSDADAIARIVESCRRVVAAWRSLRP